MAESSCWTTDDAELHPETGCLESGEWLPVLTDGRSRWLACDHCRTEWDAVAKTPDLIGDLEALAHELENDCNYPFATLKDAAGDFYRAKLYRLRKEIPKLLQDRAYLGGALQLLHEHGIMPSSTGLIAATERARKK